MIREQFNQYIKKPGQLDQGSLAELENLLGEYPYFQAARMLYVKNLKNLDNIKFNKQLKQAAAYVNNRQFLFGLLNDIAFDESGSFYPIKLDFPGDRNAHSKNMDDSDSMLALADDSAENRVSVADDNISPYNKSFYVQELEKFIPVADLDLLLFDFPVEDKETLEFDFEGELPEFDSGHEAGVGEQDEAVEDTTGVSTRDLIEQFIQHDIESSDKKSKSPDPAKGMELIDDFIRTNPRMPRPVETDQQAKDISLESLQDSDAFMTETLAEIYLKQGYYYKALQAYEKLSLKYPEKSIYFATQIQKIKKLITNQ